MPRTTIPSSLWNDICAAVEPGTVVDPPYTTIHLGSHIESGFGAFVETPFSRDTPDGTTDDPSENGMPSFESDTPDTNERVAIDSNIGQQLLDIFETQIDSVVTHNSFGRRFGTALIGEHTFAATFVYFTRLTDSPELVQEFKSLLSTLGYADTPDEVAFGSEVEPIDYPETDRPYDLGMPATAYMHTDAPHEYWADCDSLEEYIDMLVDQGADREKLENRDSYHNHVHPQTTYTDLTTEQEQALVSWHDALKQHVDRDLTFTGTPLKQRFGTVSVTEGGDIELEYLVSVGDGVPEPPEEN